MALWKLRLREITIFTAAEPVDSDEEEEEDEDSEEDLEDDEESEEGEEDEEDLPADEFNDDNQQWLTPKGKMPILQGKSYIWSIISCQTPRSEKYQKYVVR